jgi:hypothetical protein
MEDVHSFGMLGKYNQTYHQHIVAMCPRMEIIKVFNKFCYEIYEELDQKHWWKTQKQHFLWQKLNPRSWGAAVLLSTSLTEQIHVCVVGQLYTTTILQYEWDMVGNYNNYTGIMKRVPWSSPQTSNKSDGWRAFLFSTFVLNFFTFVLNNRVR